MSLTFKACEAWVSLRMGLADVKADRSLAAGGLSEAFNCGIGVCDMMVRIEGMGGEGKGCIGARGCIGGIGVCDVWGICGAGNKVN